MGILSSGGKWEERIIFHSHLSQGLGNACPEDEKLLEQKLQSPEVSFCLLDRAFPPWQEVWKCSQALGPFSEQQKGIARHFQFLGAEKLVGTTTFVFPVGLK